MAPPIECRQCKLKYQNNSKMKQHYERKHLGVPVQAPRLNKQELLAAYRTLAGENYKASTSHSSGVSTSQQTSRFEQTGTTKTLFNAATQAGPGQQATNQQRGTSIVKFQAPQVRQQCITFMQEYAKKSLEELRIEDYAANRGPQGGAGMFGA